MEDNLFALAIVESGYPELLRYILDKRQTILLGAARRHFKAGNKKSCFRYVRAAVTAGGLINALFLSLHWLRANHF